MREWVAWVRSSRHGGWVVARGERGHQAALGSVSPGAPTDGARARWVSVSSPTREAGARRGPSGFAQIPREPSGAFFQGSEGAPTRPDRNGGFVFLGAGGGGSLGSFFREHPPGSFVPTRGRRPPLGSLAHGPDSVAGVHPSKTRRESSVTALRL